jgi:hypothetical protein
MTATLPELPYAAWKDTLLYLHLVSQIAGKVRLALHPPINHWWHVTQYVTSRGLSTGEIPYPGKNFDLELDLLGHALVARTSDGRSKQVALGAKPICDTYGEVMATLAELGIEVAINAKPFKCRSTTPFPEDTAHAAYDRAYIERAFTALREIEAVFKEFRGRFVGKCSPVQLYWHSFDLACTRFSGRRAPVMEGADRVTKEAYSHEVISAGFWFGDDKMPEPAFYCYASPSPPELMKAPLAAPAKWHELWGSTMAVLRYDDLRAAKDPRVLLLDFLQSAYDGAARAAKWDPELVRAK